MTKITMDNQTWTTLHRHLLPEVLKNEEAAFLFGSPLTEENTIQVLGYRLLAGDDFVEQKLDYLELRNEARSSLIKSAHDLKACLIEIHSHPGSQVAAFSLADFRGLRDTVPHMLWRLRGQPYIAIVVSNRNFDALVWHMDIRRPTLLAGIKLGDHLLQPTNLSLRRWQ